MAVDAKLSAESKATRQAIIKMMSAAGVKPLEQGASYILNKGVLVIGVEGVAAYVSAAGKLSVIMPADKGSIYIAMPNTVTESDLIEGTKIEQYILTSTQKKVLVDADGNEILDKNAKLQFVDVIDEKTKKPIPMMKFRGNIVGQTYNKANY